MMRYAAILNPAAHQGRAGRQERALAAAFRGAGLDVRFYPTQAPGHAAELARTAAGEADAVLAVGGDGTLHEVVRGLLAGPRVVPLGVVPLGTGNDFAGTIGMPGDIGGAVRALARAVPEPLDYGLIRWGETGLVHECPFINVAGVGFDAQVALDADAFKKLPGVLGYLLATLRALRRWNSPSVRISRGTASEPGPLCYEGPCLFVSVGNGPRAGGGFRLNPQASVSDGLLDACIVEAAPIHRILWLLPATLWGGHTGAPEVHMHRLASLTLTSTEPLPLHADGEVLSRRAHHVEVRVVPRGLPVLVPPV
jgi:YegS/Rv2252/BmrU family lipid kinase